MGENDILTGIDLFISQAPEAIAKYPKLQLISKGDKLILEGELDVIDNNGKNWETYEIEIHCSALFPKRFPDLYEVGDKIPKIGDWHIYEDTLTCCVKVLPEEILRCINGISLEQYITNEVMPYLFNQTHRKVEGFYINGEYGHGDLGLYEYYSEILCTKDLISISKLLYQIGNVPKPNRTSLCFCGSGKKYRYCHRNGYELLSPLGEILIQHATRFFNKANQK